MSRDVHVRLKDMLQACRKVTAYTRGYDFDSFVADDKTLDAVIRNLEVLGEAAKHVPDDFRAGHPEIEWKKIAGLRDVVSHEYFGIDDVIIWDVVENKIPALESALSQLVRLDP